MEAGKPLRRPLDIRARFHLDFATGLAYSGRSNIFIIRCKSWPVVRGQVFVSTVEAVR